MKIRHRPYPLTKINSNQIIDLNVKYKAVKRLEDYMRENLDDLGYENDFSDSSKEIIGKLGFPGSSDSKVSAYNAGDPVSIPGSWEDPLEKEMATHSSILAWKIPWTEDAGRLQSMGSQRVEHN